MRCLNIGQDEGVQVHRSFIPPDWQSVGSSFMSWKMGNSSRMNVLGIRPIVITRRHHALENDKQTTTLNKLQVHHSPKESPGRSGLVASLENRWVSLELVRKDCQVSICQPTDPFYQHKTWHNVLLIENSDKITNL